jgi:DNA-binding MarR family transcriptional regulator
LSITKQNKSELVIRVMEQIKETSTWSIMLHQSIANILNLNITDHKCFDYILKMGSVTAGQLADHTGLTTGAVTALVDRLEKRGYVKRDRDPNDRRQVIIKPIEMSESSSMVEIFSSLYKESVNLISKYNEQELSLILDFLLKSNEMTQEKVKILREITKKK